MVYVLYFDVALFQGLLALLYDSIPYVLVIDLPFALHGSLFCPLNLIGVGDLVLFAVISKGAIGELVSVVTVDGS